MATRLESRARSVFDRLQTLGDETRVRLLLLLEEHELTVSELCAVVQLPQSTVSRHLKVLGDGGWARARAEGTSRHYRWAEPDGAAAELWSVVRETARSWPQAMADAERVREVLAQRRERSRAFFSKAAADWDALRDELFGAGSETQALLGLLDPAWTVADLGAGTGSLSVRLAPFVAGVIAVDGSDEMLSALRGRARGADNIDARAGELERLPIEEASVDIAFMVLVLHYVVEPPAALSEAMRVLRPGGRLIVVDMREHDREEYRAGMGHVWTGFSDAQIVEWASDCGCSDVRITALPPAVMAKGPSLFLATMRKRSS
ncbi:MAG: metalloregulator ArsR/SmtB family transcription factor [Gemmatimonadetes bacterium]|nr:metalloregulator ArsR/SmtB family transcription factor [Gemmatimonadota bacterium]